MSMQADGYRLILKDGQFDNSAQFGRLQQFEATIEKIKQEKADHLVLHLHGGLIDRAAGTAAAEKLTPYYRAAGAVPLFLVWESGAFEVIQQRINAIANEDLFQTIMSRVTQFVGGKLKKEVNPNGAEGATRAADTGLPLDYLATTDAELDKGKKGEAMFADTPVDLLPPSADTLDSHEQEQIVQELEGDPQLEEQLRAIGEGSASEPGSKGLAASDTTPTLIDPAVKSDLFPEQPAEGAARSLFSTALAIRRILDIVSRVVWRLAHGRHHGPYLTIVEEVLRGFYVGPVGKFVWDAMKTAIENAFADPDAGGTVLVDRLARMAREGQLRKFTVVGHSAGAIYAARLIRALDEKLPDEAKLNLILIAPACSFKVLADALRSAGRRVVGMRVFGMGDPIELSDHIVPLIYPASLLYFVSGVLEQDSDEPLVGMQRFYADTYVGEAFSDIGFVRRFDYLTRAHAFAWSEAAGQDGANCDMRSHGGWVDAEQTRLSVMYTIQNGFGYA